MFNGGVMFNGGKSRPLINNGLIGALILWGNISFGGVMSH